MSVERTDVDTHRRAAVKMDGQEKRVDGHGHERRRGGWTWTDGTCPWTAVDINNSE